MLTLLNSNTKNVIIHIHMHWFAAPDLRLCTFFLSYEIGRCPDEAEIKLSCLWTQKNRLTIPRVLLEMLKFYGIRRESKWQPYPIFIELATSSRRMLLKTHQKFGIYMSFSPLSLRSIKNPGSGYRCMYDVCIVSTLSRGHCMYVFK